MNKFQANKHIKCKQTLFLLLLCFIINSCTEPYALQTNSYDEAIVIEATITNELKNQQIKISKTYRFEENGPTSETGAIVYITDNVGNQYDFEEKDGVYVSIIPFQAVPEREYRLSVTTKDGKAYTSRNEILTPVNEIASITANIAEKDKVRGVQINVNSFDPTGKSRFYRFEYEETYKIVAPNYNKLQIFAVGPQKVDFKLRTVDVKTCFTSKKSLDIILTSTNDLAEDRVNYPIRFIADNDPVIAQRYSILVRQYVQNLAAYTYFETLKKTAGSESILSQNQPGFFYGNIKSMDNSNEKVIGFFEVSSVSQKRIFFNYYDIFPGEKRPPYFYECEEQTFPFCFPVVTPSSCKGNELIGALKLNGLTLVGGDFGENPNSQFDDIYTMVPSPCGDCTTFSSTLKPLFWID
jgi:hypothetical protein